MSCKKQNIIACHFQLRWEPLWLHIQRANYVCSPQDRVAHPSVPLSCREHLLRPTFTFMYLSLSLSLPLPTYPLSVSLSFSLFNLARSLCFPLALLFIRPALSPSLFPSSRSSTVSFQLRSPRSTSPAAPPWYSSLINCVYTAVNSYRCLAPANWSSSPSPLVPPHARNADTRRGYPPFNSRGMISSSQPSLCHLARALSFSLPLSSSLFSFSFSSSFALV